MTAKGNRGVTHPNVNRMSPRQAIIPGSGKEDKGIKSKPNTNLRPTGSSFTMVSSNMLNPNSTAEELHKDQKIPNRGKQIERIKEVKHGDGKRDNGRRYSQERNAEQRNG